MKHWILWLLAGIVLIIGGIFALANPFAATLTATAIAAWSFLIGGVIQLFAAFTQEGTSNKIWSGVTGVLGILVGIALFNNPFAGIISLTMLVAIMFLVIGAAKVFVSFSLKGTQAFWPVLISGALSVILALMIFGNFPQSAATILGILLAVELISSGISLVMLSLSSKSTAAV
ncbi:HdeD family acid-resistance protein [Falsihalocynthiibacter sp. SS001]|uniref:HdeD family acid-resistance protein n=1 Tax=Falsihalocynthiibacter sp. SS001 TaxID=3349698 RepID=UPI0036D3616C